MGKLLLVLVLELLFYIRLYNVNIKEHKGNMGDKFEINDQNLKRELRVKW